MPRIPRLGKSAPEAPQAPEAPADQPTEVTSGDPLAATEAPPAVESDEARTDATPDGAVVAPSGDAGETTSSDRLTFDDAPPPATDATAPPAATLDGDPLGGSTDQPTIVAPAAGGGGAVAAGDAVTTGEPLAPAAGEVVTPGEDSATVVEEAPADAAPGFRSRARIRRRLRYLRRYRELAFRDLGGLMFDLHRFGRDRPDLLAQKLDGLTTVDVELRALQAALRERRDVTELREVGVASCPRCQTLHGTDANFCPGCGTALRGAVVRDAAPVTVTPAGQQPAQAQHDTPPT